MNIFFNISFYSLLFLQLFTSVNILVKLPFLLISIFIILFNLNQKVLKLLFFILIFMIYFFLQLIFNDVVLSYFIKHLFILLSFFLVLLLYLSQKDSEDFDKMFFKNLSSFFVLLGLFKVFLIFIYFTFYKSDFDQMLFLLRNTLNLSVISDRSSDLLFRIQFKIDFILPFILYGLLTQVRLKNIYCNKFFLIILILSIVLTGSRIIWALSIIFCIYHIFKSSKLKNIIVFFCSSLITIFTFKDLIFRKLSYEQIEISDSKRIEQFNHLIKWFFEEPFFGHGLGSYISHYVREPSLPFSYELQIIAFLGQVGILGFIYFFLIMAVFFLQKKINLNLFIFLITIILMSFNPILISFFGAIIFILIKIFNNEKFIS